MKRCEGPKLLSNNCDKQAEFAMASDKEETNYWVLCDDCRDYPERSGLLKVLGEICPECDEVIDPSSPGGGHTEDCGHTAEVEEGEKADRAYDEHR